MLSNDNKLSSSQTFQTMWTSARPLYITTTPLDLRYYNSSKVQSVCQSSEGWELLDYIITQNIPSAEDWLSIEVRANQDMALTFLESWQCISVYPAPTSSIRRPRIRFTKKHSNLSWTTRTETNWTQHMPGATGGCSGEGEKAKILQVLSKKSFAVTLASQVPMNKKGNQNALFMPTKMTVHKSSVQVSEPTVLTCRHPWLGLSHVGPLIHGSLWHAWSIWNHALLLQPCSSFLLQLLLNLIDLLC